MRLAFRRFSLAMINTLQNRVWSCLLLGWATGLWAVWAMLNWFPFIKADSPLILPVAAVVLVLFIAGVLVDLPPATSDRVTAAVFIGLVLWSTWLLHSGSTSIGLSLAALAGLLVYWQHLDRLSQQGNGAMLKRPHVLSWLFWAALLEGLGLIMPLTAFLPEGEPLGMVVVVGFLWMNASLIGGPSGHYTHETSLPEIKAPPPILGVFFIPWSIGVLSMVLGVAAWGYVLASLLSAGTAFISRLRILQATQKIENMTEQVICPVHATDDKKSSPNLSSNI